MTDDVTGAGDNPTAGGAPNADSGKPGNGKGGAPAATSWDSGFTADQTELVKTKGWKGAGDVLKSYSELEGKMGSRIAIPGESATDDERNAFYSKLGRPETADAYDMSTVKAPESFPVNEGVQKNMLGEMHRLGISQAQAQGLMSAYFKFQGEEYANYLKSEEGKAETALKTPSVTMESLKKDWGSDYDAKLDVANRAVKVAFGEGLEEAKGLKLEDGSYLLDNPHLAKAFANLGARLVEDSEMIGNGQGGGMATTLAQVEARIKEIRDDPAYANKKDPKNAELSAEMDKLYAQRAQARGEN